MSPTRRLPAKEKNAAEVPAMRSTMLPYSPQVTTGHAAMEVNCWRKTVKSENEEAEALLGYLNPSRAERKTTPEPSIG
ncbi:MAG: hypothetical protein BJ554DRAFT_544 [Olpidium bornovanus]|uniref:Uncharacterized protein n=1 Tax=Olpidium bornovanus TaxID=278681 RepID=A0A8H8A247_9FUNG|nr:MAG: hypothetical protein BJ554DRAFT_544 [Olpidium bornovanus]